MSSVRVSRRDAIPTHASHAQWCSNAGSCVERVRCVSAPAMSVVAWTWEVSIKSWISEVFSGASRASVLLIRGDPQLPRPGRADVSGSLDQTPHRNPRHVVIFVNDFGPDQRNVRCEVPCGKPAYDEEDEEPLPAHEVKM